jgi:hypothetical protein
MAALGAVSADYDNSAERVLKTGRAMPGLFLTVDHSQTLHLICGELGKEGEKRGRTSASR